LNALSIWGGSSIFLVASFGGIAIGNSDLKRIGQQCDDDGYSHNAIPDLVQNK
jgi:hypothetical protein